MSNFTFSTDKTNVSVNQNPDGSVSVKTEPKDFKTNGAADVSLDRTRGDDGSVTIVVGPRKSED